MTALLQDPLAPPCAYLLADHLDAVLAAGEDLTEAAKEWPAVACKADVDVADVRTGQRITLDKVRALELTVVVRLLTARERARELKKIEDRFAIMAELFLSGTGMIADTAAEIGNGAMERADFDAPECASHYFRSRGLIAADAAQLRDGTPLEITGDFLIAGKVPLGVLMELVDMFLQTLEMHYDLFAEATDFQAVLRSGAPEAA